MNETPEIGSKTRTMAILNRYRLSAKKVWDKTF